MKTPKNANTYIRGFCNILINILFITILIAIGLCIYKLIYFILKTIPNISTLYGNLISASVTIILALISYIAKLKKYIPILLHKFKQRIYQFFAWRYNPFSAFVITDYNKFNLLETEEQGKFISSAIHVLKSNTQNMILISGYSGKGKTTSIMLLLSAIARDKELYWVFSELQNHIIYFDSVNDKSALLNYLGNTGKQKCKLIIVDNIQKYTISSINEIMGRVNNLALHNKNANKKVLIIFLYQETGRNNSLYDYVRSKYFKDENNIFKLNKYVKLEEKNSQEPYFSQAEELMSHIYKIEDAFYQQYMKNVFLNRKDDSIVIFLNDLIFNEPDKIPSDKEKTFFVLIIAIFIGLYNGYVTKKDLHFLWKKNYSFFSLPQENLLIKYYVRNRVFVPFPFVRSAYIFNEQLAKEYRKRLIHNNYYQEKSCMIAESMFLYCEESMPQKWLLFLLCSSDYCKNFSQQKRIRYFENTLAAYHLQYILDLVETEISILPEKKKIFRQELGIIYIYNGEWTKAKQILYPYMKSHDINKDIWHIQLKIIEAEHGCNDEKYLEMLTSMETECTDPVILFQVRYWREHIRMEHGDFSLDAWERLVRKLVSDNELEILLEDEHFIARIVSDYERTYFLKGNINYSIYGNIASKYMRLNNKNCQNVEPIEYVLSRAYYIQYDVLYQLGIWGYAKHGEIDPDIIRNPEIDDTNNTMNILLKEAMDKYDFCIRKYQSEGKKKYRTLEVRRAELSLCADSNHYIEILNQYKKFEDYAAINDIAVFEGYCNTQKGKAFALYADYMLRCNDIGRYEEYLKKAEDYLLQAKQIYEKWRNSYGVFRAELLSILVHMMQNKERTELVCINPDTYRNRYSSLLLKLTEKYNSEQQFLREYDIIEYLQHNISRMDIPLRILKFYPIILQ